MGALVRYIRGGTYRASASLGDTKWPPMGARRVHLLLSPVGEEDPVRHEKCSTRRGSMTSPPCKTYNIHVAKR